MKIIIGFLLIGWIFNLCKECIVWIFECIEEKDWLCLALPFIVIALGIFITWLLYHFGIIQITQPFISQSDETNKNKF